MARQKYTTGPGWRIEWRKFTKADAHAALGKVREDRAPDAAWVAALTREMDLDLWDTYSPAQVPLAFDRDGFRLNGGHRLRAFIASKRAEIIFPVITGLSPEQFRAFDQDTKLRFKTAAHPSRSNVQRDMARVAWLQSLVSGATALKMTNREFSLLAEGRWSKQLAWADETLPHGGKQGKAPYAAALMYAHRLDPDFAEKVGKAWANGGAGLPAALLRLRDTALSVKTVHAHRASRVGHTFKMLNALALMHRGDRVPDRIPVNTAGLRYFSERLRDGAAARWDKQGTVTEEA